MRKKSTHPRWGNHRSCICYDGKHSFCGICFDSIQEFVLIQVKCFVVFTKFSFLLLEM